MVGHPGGVAHGAFCADVSKLTSPKQRQGHGKHGVVRRASSSFDGLVMEPSATSTVVGTESSDNHSSCRTFNQKLLINSTRAITRPSPPEIVLWVCTSRTTGACRREPRCVTQTCCRFSCKDNISLTLTCLGDQPGEKSARSLRTLE